MVGLLVVAGELWVVDILVGLDNAGRGIVVRE